MQKVQGLIFAFLYCDFFSFIIPLRYFLYSAVFRISISYTLIRVNVRLILELHWVPAQLGFEDALMVDNLNKWCN